MLPPPKLPLPRRADRPRWLRPPRRSTDRGAATARGLRPGGTRYARSGDLRIAYELHAPVLARRRPWLVLIQGLGFDRAGWSPILGELQRHFRLVLLDNRGSGDSDPSPQRFQVGDMANDVVAVLDHAGIAKAHLLGISLGGMIAQTVAAEHPQRVDSLVLAATTPGLPLGHPPPTESLALFAADRLLPADTRRRRHVQNALSTTTVRDHPEIVDRLVAHVSARPANPQVATMQAIAGAGYLNRHGPHAISARTLVLHGDADTVVDPRNAHVLATSIPDAELVVFPALGHLMFWEDPDAFLDAVLSFLRRPQQQ